MKRITSSSKAAIDLASIMVGVIVIGLIGAVIAATIFLVIPWAQDNAAKQQLDAVHAAQDAYYGLSADPSRDLEEGQERNSYGNSEGLDQAGLLKAGESYCTTQTTKDNYLAYSLSATGKIWFATNTHGTATVLTGNIDPHCDWLIPDPPKQPTTPRIYGDVTSFTYRCDTTTANVTPPMFNVTGELLWTDSNGTAVGDPQTLTNQTPAGVTLQGGQTYKVSLQGTFGKLRNTTTSSSTVVVPHSHCLRSLDEWNENTGTQDAAYGLTAAPNLERVPEQIPSTVTDLQYLFRKSTAFNQPLDTWDVKNVRNMTSMFAEMSYNQPLNSWNMSKVTSISFMFYKNPAFNQHINSWDVSKVSSTSSMFVDAVSFNQPLNKWQTTSLMSTTSMFAGATSFNQPLSRWDVSGVNSIAYMFREATSFNQNINSWKTGNVTTAWGVFRGATSFNQPLNNWNMSKVTNISHMFAEATSFNQPLDKWKLVAVKDVNNLFTRATSFNQPLNSWDNMPKLGIVSHMFSNATSFNQPLDKLDVSNVTEMSYMFSNATSFNQPLNDWNVSKITKFENFNTNGILTPEHMPKFTTQP